MRTIGVVTVARSDYSIYLPVLRRIHDAPDLELHLIASGTHLSPEFGMTASQIEQDGFHIADRVEMLLSSDTPEGIGKSMGIGTIGFAQAYARCRPDILLVLGDRFEMHAAVVAAVPFNIPVAHIHGGELTEGAIDDVLRHSITKMSHLHFVANETYAKRVIQMGEEPWRVTVSGAPGLDNLCGSSVMSADELDRRFGLDVSSPFLLVTYHPVTLEYEKTESQVGELLAALKGAGYPVVFTYPNADTNGRIIIDMINEFTAKDKRSKTVSNLGPQGYASLLKHATVMVGNSSSGIIEAPTFGLPVVNVGTRQQGRICAKNIINVGYSRSEIAQGIQTAVSPGFRDELTGLQNPYGDGQAADKIVRRLTQVELGDDFCRKRFNDV